MKRGLMQGRGEVPGGAGLSSCGESGDLIGDLGAAMDQLKANCVVQEEVEGW